MALDPAEEHADDPAYQRLTRADLRSITSGLKVGQQKQAVYVTLLRLSEEYDPLGTLAGLVTAAPDKLHERLGLGSTEEAVTMSQLAALRSECLGSIIAWC